MKECLHFTAGFRIELYEQALFIKLPVQLGEDYLNQCFLYIICLAHSIITSHESPIPALESIVKEFSAAVRFHTSSTSAILYQILDSLIDEDMTFVLEARREIESLEETIDQEPEAAQSAVFMQLTLIAGIYGMNFRQMPELKWTYGYPLVITIMLILAAVLLLMFYWNS